MSVHCWLCWWFSGQECNKRRVRNEEKGAAAEICLEGVPSLTEKLGRRQVCSGGQSWQRDGAGWQGRGDGWLHGGEVTGSAQ